MDANPVNPAHYQKGNGIETIDYIEAVCADIPGEEAVSLANVIKYVSRYRQKNPLNPARDLEKARWYLDRLIALVKLNSQTPVLPPDPIPQWAPCKLPEGTGVVNEAWIKTNTPRPGDAPGSRDRKSDTDGWRDDYSNKGPNLKYPCSECGSEPGRKHFMSCSEYTGHF